MDTTMTDAEVEKLIWDFTHGDPHGRSEWEAKLAGTIVAYRQRIEGLERELKASREASLGVGSGGGNLFVHGDYESIKVCQAKLLELEGVRRELSAERHAREQAEAKVAAVERFRDEMWHRIGGDIRCSDAGRRLDEALAAPASNEPVWPHCLDKCSADQHDEYCPVKIWEGVRKAASRAPASEPTLRERANEAYRVQLPKTSQDLREKFADAFEDVDNGQVETREGAYRMFDTIIALMESKGK